MGWQRAIALITFASSVLLCITVSDALGVTHYVSKAGSSTPPYTTWATAAWFIESAVEVSTPGDTVRVEAGNYHVLTSLVITTPGIVLMGAGIDSTRITGKNDLDCILLPADDITVKDFTFVGDTLANHGSELFGPLAAMWIPYPFDRISFTVEHCRFERFRGAAIYTLDDVDNCWIRDCVFYDLRGESLVLGHLGNYIIENCTFQAHPYYEAFGFIDFTTSKGLKIVRGCSFEGETGGWDAIDCGLFGWGYLEIDNNVFFGSNGYLGCVYADVAQLIIRNNSVYFNDPLKYDAVVFQCYAPNLDSVVIENNAIYATTGKIRVSGGSPEKCRIANNIQYSRACRPPSELISVDLGNPDAVEIEDNLFHDPMFVDGAAGDFRLQLGSPCIDNGSPGLLDFDSSLCDIGATGGPGGSVYPYENYPALSPRLLTGTIVGNSVHLSWLANTESDLANYQIYRDASPLINVDSDHLIATVLLTDQNRYDGTDSDSEFVAYVDTLESRQSNYYYAVHATDQFGAVSASSEVLEITLTDVEDAPDLLPENFILNQNYPNPFNATTAIVYSLPNIGAQPAMVRLTIYNILGQEVRTLVDQPQAVGKHIAYWDGRDYTGRDVASGVYFYSLRISGIDFVKNRRMVLVK